MLGAENSAFFSRDRPVVLHLTYGRQSQPDLLPSATALSYGNSLIDTLMQ